MKHKELNLQGDYEQNRLLEDLKSSDTLAQNRALNYMDVEFKPWVANMVRLRGGDEDQARDVMQESLIRVYEKVRAKTFKGESKLRTFFYSVAKFVWMEQSRRDGKAMTGMDELPEPEPDDKPQFGLEEAELVKQVAVKLKLLGPKCRKILLDCYWEGKSMDEIAEGLGFKNADVAKNKKAKCMKKLRKMFK